MDPAAYIGFNCPKEEIFMHMEKMMTGSPLPSNVLTDVNPFKFKPSDLPDGMWYLICSKENIDAVHGLWKAKGEACEVFSNFFMIGWMTTLEFYEGQVPHEHKTNWVMQEFRITEKRPSESNKEKEAGSLCRVFLGDRQNPNHDKQQKTSSAYTSREAHSHSTQPIYPNAENDSRQGSTSQPQANKDGETGGLAVAERLPNHHVENLSENYYLSGGDYLELLDLDHPASPSSSESSSCLTMSSDDFFDLLALEDLESESYQDLVQKDAGYKFRASVPNKVVMSPAISGSCVSIGTEEILRTNRSGPGSAMGNRDVDNKVLKHAVRSSDHKDEGPSTNSHNLATSSRGHMAAPDRIMKAAVDRIKGLKKEYYCFMPF